MISEDLEKKYEDLLLEILRRCALRSRQFCDNYCIPDGLIDRWKIRYLKVEYPEINNSSKLSYDYDYYAFTKATKTLHAIWTLYKDTQYYFNEDILNLIRSMFESHILSRYVRENIDDENNTEAIINDFINNPLGMAYALYTVKFINRRGCIIDEQGNKKGKPIMGPKDYILGQEENYYRSFYSYLCSFAHCDFATITCYMDRGNFTYNKNNCRLECLLFTIFVFTKILEGVVTVEGEDFATYKEEKSYYDLVYDSLELQEEIFEYLIEKYSQPQHEGNLVYLYFNEDKDSKKHIKFCEMLCKMKESLKDEIGSLTKQKISDNTLKYTRSYPIHT